MQTEHISEVLKRLEARHISRAFVYDLHADQEAGLPERADADETRSQWRQRRKLMIHAMRRAEDYAKRQQISKFFTEVVNKISEQDSGQPTEFEYAMHHLAKEIDDELDNAGPSLPTEPYTLGPIDGSPLEAAANAVKAMIPDGDFPDEIGDVWDQLEDLADTSPRATENTKDFCNYYGALTTMWEWAKLVRERLN